MRDKRKYDVIVIGAGAAGMMAAIAAGRQQTSVCSKKMKSPEKRYI